MTSLLEASDLRAFYGPTEVLHQLAFSVGEGTITALLGANGAGKTTTLRAICGLVRSSGEVRFAGTPIGGRAAEDIVRLGIAHVPEGRGTFLSFTVEENLQLGAHVRRDKSQRRSDVDRLYGYFPILAERRRQQAGTLSGGEQQMLALSRALMSRPRLLLLDEPSLGLAPIVVQEIFRIMRRINAEEGMSILLVEQNVNLALGLSDHAYLLETGRLALSGPSKELRKHEAVRRSYLGY